ncbi:MAG: Unknown protein [uncultured Sulfurovum sp.]|uniref:Periplasmic protein n=1 Tax=uncultured Sulfurovum sp. TaxID=269237 RepID=A0A6S6TLA8_9BACT|nr:MAG: Unknown protein [uncultured Sulfurovum sp.]
MKKLILASILAVGLGSVFVYANQAAQEREHHGRVNAGDDGYGQQDMGNMKVEGKCNTAQTDKRKTKAKKHTPSKSELEREHQDRVNAGDDGYGQQDMGNMKVEGKCNTD